jgi:hypothetical protein
MTNSFQVREVKDSHWQQEGNRADGKFVHRKSHFVWGRLGQRGLV